MFIKNVPFDLRSTSHFVNYILLLKYHLITGKALKLYKLAK